jgi:hypothetical protein
MHRKFSVVEIVASRNSLYRILAIYVASGCDGRWLQGRRKRQRLGTAKALGWSMELVERPRKLAPEEVL